MTPAKKKAAAPAAIKAKKPASGTSVEVGKLADMLADRILGNVIGAFEVSTPTMSHGSVEFAPPPEPGRMSMLSEASMELDNVMTALSMRLDDLEGKLGPMLAPLQTSPEAGSTGNAEKPATSPVVEYLNGRSLMVRRMLARVDQLVNRLEC